MPTSMTHHLWQFWLNPTHKQDTSSVAILVMSCSQAGATLYGVPTCWEDEGHVGIEAAGATMSQWHMPIPRPAQLEDIVIPGPVRNGMCLWQCQELDRAQKLIQEGMNILKRVRMDPPQEGSFGSYKKARQASEAHAGGGYTQLWNSLHQDKTAISLVAVSPPTLSEQGVEYSDERRLLIAIYQCDYLLQGLCLDIYTSIQEIDNMSQVVICVRYPKHMGERLQKMCKKLNTVTVENHKFSAKVVTEGMAPDHWTNPWLLHIWGQRLAALDEEAITAATMMQPAACEDSPTRRFIRFHTYHHCFHKCLAGEHQSALRSILLKDWQWIQKTNKVFRLAQNLASNDEMQTMHVYLTISGLVIDAATQGRIQPGPEVWLYTCDDWAVYDCDQELMMSTRVGDTILALDRPFWLHSASADCIVNLDSVIYDGIWAVYGLKYEVDDDKGIVFKQAGLSMLQHLSTKTHNTQLHSFRVHITPHIAQFSAKIAVKHSGQVGEPASSSPAGAVSV